MLCLRLATLIVLFLVFVSSQEYLRSLDDQYQQEQVELRKEICVLKPEFGKCKGRRNLWYFNDRYGKCMIFTYSNCGGNRNRFYSKESCVDFCDRFDWSAGKLKRKSLSKWTIPSRKVNPKRHA